MTNTPRTLNEELKARDQQIQELKEELEKCLRREGILESLYTAQESHSWSISHKERMCNESYDLYQDLKLRLSEDGLPEDVRADIEKRMAEEREEFLAVQAEIIEQERKHNELVKSLKDELDSLK